MPRPSTPVTGGHAIHDARSRHLHAGRLPGRAGGGSRWLRLRPRRVGHLAACHHTGAERGADRRLRLRRAEPRHLADAPPGALAATSCRSWSAGRSASRSAPRSCAMYLQQTMRGVLGGFLIVFCIYYLAKPDLGRARRYPLLDGVGRRVRRRHRLADGARRHRHQHLDDDAGPAQGRAARGVPAERSDPVHPDLAWFGGAGIIPEGTGRLFLIGLPLVLIGTWIGLRLYGHLNEANFRRIGARPAVRLRPDTAAVAVQVGRAEGRGCLRDQSDRAIAGTVRNRTCCARSARCA